MSLDIGMPSIRPFIGTFLEFRVIEMSLLVWRTGCGRPPLFSSCFQRFTFHGSALRIIKIITVFCELGICNSFKVLSFSIEKILGLEVVARILL